jgi:hypothetical protein
MTSRKQADSKTASDTQPSDGAPPPSSSDADPEALLQILSRRGLHTPDQIKEFIDSYQALAGEVQNLKDEMQVLREKKASAPLEPVTGPTIQNVTQATGLTPQGIMLQALDGQGIDTPEKLGQYFTSVGALQGQVKDLQDQLQTLQEKNKTIGGFDQDVEDLKQISAKGREIQELRKVFPTTDPVNIALAARLMEGLGGGGNEIQALRKELNDLKSAQTEERHRQDMRDLSDRMSGEVGRLEQQVLILQGEITNKTPRGSAIEELKGVVDNYKKVQEELKELGLATGTGEKKSAIEKALDIVGDKLMNVAEKYGLIDMVLTGGQSMQGTGRPPPPPTDLQGKPYSQDEFNNAAIVWVRDDGRKLLKDQISIDDRGFIMGYGEHIHKYIAQRNPQGVRPYITPDDHYVVPNSLSEDYLVWVRQNVPQQPVPQQPAPQQPGPGASSERTNTGF